jgi:hypothetical protein
VDTCSGRGDDSSRKLQEVPYALETLVYLRGLATGTV